MIQSHNAQICARVNAFRSNLHDGTSPPPGCPASKQLSTKGTLNPTAYLLALTHRFPRRPA